jgi:hypothetical protein
MGKDGAGANARRRNYHGRASGHAYGEADHQECTKEFAKHGATQEITHHDFTLSTVTWRGFFSHKIIPVSRHGFQEFGQMADCCQVTGSFCAKTCYEGFCQVLDWLNKQNLSPFRSDKTVDKLGTTLAST